MKQKVEEGLDTFGVVSENSDGLGSLKAIKNLALNFQSQERLLRAPHKSKHHVVHTRKARTQQRLHAWNHSRAPLT